MKRRKSKYDIILRRLHGRIYAFSPLWWLIILTVAFGFIIGLAAYIQICLYLEAVYIPK